MPRYANDLEGTVPDPQPDGTFTSALLEFGRLCRASGLRVTTGQVLDLCRAADSFTITDIGEFYSAARCIFLSRHAEEPLFADLFNRFWLKRVHPHLPTAAQDMQSDLLKNEGDSAESDEQIAEGRPVQLLVDMPESEADANTDAGEPGEVDTIAAFSAAEVLRQKDFSLLEASEIAEIRRLIAELRWQAATRKLRRTKRATKGPHLDPRRALRENLAKGGELITLPRRTPRRKPRPLVLICDISGSMERYTSLLLRFLHALRQGRGGVETFVFGTRLTRITRQLRVRDTDAAIAEVAGEVIDWGGGTRIGESLASFNRHWGRRVLGHGATVVIISDGWDRGDPAVLATEMAHLQRLSHRLIWLNPLLGLAGYEPLTRGMRAALPYIDDFLASHNLASLQQLAEFLQSLDDHRPERGHRETVAQLA
ncbi:MAG: domain containing CoxE-like protein [Chloroflexi bacterium]|nr:domain containing CoxE-like protein [Chloroflexota bacterium]